MRLHGCICFFLAYLRSFESRDKFKNTREININSNFSTNAARKRRFGRAKLSEALLNNSEDSKRYAEGLKISYAQDKEDIWLYENFFYGKVNGVIIESGALDGYWFSTSSFFERFANWTAVHIEPDPKNYKRLIKNRPKAININAALCTEPRNLHFVNYGFGAVHGILEFMSDEFLKTNHPNIYQNHTIISNLPIIPCTPMKLLLQQIRVRQVDIWILDVEGAEEEALRGTDFLSVHFSVIVMECDDTNFIKNKRKTDLIDRYGYECRLILRNCICKHRRFQSSSREVKSELRLHNGTFYKNEGWM
mmetsp:Transcript_27866/g.28127  ORF Transcript_27866/g.28127 Transcript_27866/m.28127 type:complete len:306 (+) Transcript_27866:39-956(+)